MHRTRYLDGRTLRNRIVLLLLFFAVIQVSYYLFLSEGDRWFALVVLGYAGGILLVQRLIFLRMRDGDLTIPVNPSLFTFVYLICFAVVIVFSRLSYVLSFLSIGLLETRSAGLGQGGITSIIAIWFYPLCIVLAFLRIRTRQYYLLCIPMLIVLAIDIVALGTRNAPFFVFIFHAITYHGSFLKFRRMFAALGIVLLTVFIVDYQTKGRSLNTTSIGFHWSMMLEHSRIFRHAPVRDEVIELSKDWSLVGPSVYLAGYIAHSQAEFRYLVGEGSFGAFGTPNYTMDEVCLVLFCPREPFQNRIMEINPSTGLYMTTLATFLFDFGYVGTAILFVYIVLLSFVLPYRLYLPIAIYTCFVFSLGLIENYFYNGLGLARFVLFVILWQVFMSRRRSGARPAPRVPAQA